MGESYERVGNVFDGSFQAPNYTNPMGEEYEEVEEVESGGGRNVFTELIQNPGLIRSNFNLTDKQSQNVKALIASAGTGVAVKYLGKPFGDEIAAIMGAAGSAYIAKKIFGA